jgi:macrolide-specific efflux system membrane fusion protein
VKPGRAWVLLIAVLMASVFSSCYFFPKEEEVLAPPIKEPEKVNFETIQVKTGIIERNIRCTGTFVSVSQIDLYYKDRGGRLENLAVKLGDKVKKGRLIAQLETDAVENDMQLQEIALKRAQI